MKKYISFVVTCMIGVSLCACGEIDTSSENESPSSLSGASEVTTTTTAKNVTTTTSETTAESENGKKPQIPDGTCPPMISLGDVSYVLIDTKEYELPEDEMPQDYKYMGDIKEQLEPTQGPQGDLVSNWWWWPVGTKVYMNSEDKSFITVSPNGAVRISKYE